MECKLVVRRFTSGLDHIGDVVNAYPVDFYCGSSVENKDSAFAIVIVSGCDENHPDIVELKSDNMIPTTHNKIFGLTPITEGDQFYDDLRDLNRVDVTLEQLLSYKVAR